MASSASEPSIKAGIQSCGEGLFLLSGELSFSSVPGLLQEGERLLPGTREAAGNVTMDLQGVSRTDSAGLALLVEWTRDVRAQGIEITFLNIPAQMVALARLSGLEEVLSLSSGSP